MKARHTTKTVIIVSIVLLIGGAVAFAHDGYRRGMGGYGGHMMGSTAYGNHMMEYGPESGRHMRGHGAWGNLSAEEAAKLDDAREAFFSETRELRGKIDDKQIALRSELRRDTPDDEKVIELQKQISTLQADFDQKALAHQLELRKLMPESYAGLGYENGYCR